MMREWLQSLWVHPLARDLDLDSPEAIEVHGRITESKPFLRQFYQDCYQTIAEFLPDDIDAPVLEVGSGAGFLKDYIPGMIASEILKISNVDVILDARFLPCRVGSLRAIVMIDAFHHIASVADFLAEAASVLMPKGAIIMIEPWVSKWSEFVYRHLHHETMEPDAKSWGFAPGNPLTGANSALPWIVFARDLEKFENTFPELELEHILPHSPFCYLMSGGLSFRGILPGCFFKPCRRIEQWLQPLSKWLAMFATIVVRRRP